MAATAGQLSVISTFRFAVIPAKSSDTQTIVTDSAQQPLLTLGDKQYAIDSLSDQAKEMVQGLQVAEAQLRMAQDKLNVMMFARQSMLDQLQEALKDVQPVSG